MTCHPLRTVLVLLVATVLRFSAEAATYTVSNRNDSGAGSLRQAILDANANPGRDTIAFNITGATPYNIIPVSELPPIDEAVRIDGTTQPGYVDAPLIGLVGLNLGRVNGLTLQATDCEVRALAINRFQGNGIQINGNSNVVAGCFIGTSLAGTAKLANDAAGVTIVNGLANRVGGTNTNDRNLISGNGTGIYIVGFDATNNVVQGNFIGTDVNGTSRLGNENVGVLLSAPRNLIGGTTPGERNIISGNGLSGVYLNDIGATGNRVMGNYIGLRVNGSAPASNGVDGITIYYARENVIGGSTPGAGNVISGNNERGVLIIGPTAVSNSVAGNFIGTDAAGIADLGNRYTGVGIISANSNVIGGTNASARNIIAGNNQSGVAIDSNSVANIILGNFIGLDATGTNSLANNLGGVSVLRGTNNVIGGTVAGAGNVISGNTQDGVALAGGFGTVVQGNLIGTDLSGQLARGNGFNGIRIDSAGNLVGGDALGARNVISGNANNGVLFFGAAASNNVLAGNLIGTAATGATGLGNGFAGVNVSGAPRNSIGTAEPFGGNVVSANGFSGSFSGVYLNGAGTTGNRINGNFIGTDATGTTALGNFLGGIVISGSGTNLIGSSEPGARNVISGNTKVAVSIGDPGANGNVLLGNFIGTKADGTSPLGNQWHGIEFLNTASGNVVGGILPGEGNRIGYATTVAYDGVRVRDGCVQNVLRGNSIFGNAGLAIDLSTDGVSANDIGDGDAGANNVQNFPSITSQGGRFIISVSGSLNSRPNTSFMIDFYGNTEADGSGYGEGQLYVGSVSVMTDGAGNGGFVATLTNAVSAGAFLSATATDGAGNTSEFSLGVPLAASLDTDGDGLANDYEAAFGLNLNSNADADSDLDGDGASNYREFLAGTRANDNRSAFRITLRKEAQRTLIFVDSVLGKTYRVEGATDVTGPWSILGDNLAGTGTQLRVTDSVTPLRKFYRARAN